MKLTGLGVTAGKAPDDPWKVLVFSTKGLCTMSDARLRRLGLAAKLTIGIVLMSSQGFSGSWMVSVYVIKSLM